MHEHNDIYREEDVDRAFFFPSFFVVHIRNILRNGPRLMTWTKRERQEGRPPAKKCLDSAYESALVAHSTCCDYACIRRISIGTRFQIAIKSQDGLLHLCTNVDSPMLRNDEHIYLILSFLFLLDGRKIK